MQSGVCGMAAVFLTLSRVVGDVFDIGDCISEGPAHLIYALFSQYK
jgi:hypothetical protein